MGIREVADAAGVSATTASRALNGTGRISAATRARVREAADGLDYRPNELARQLKVGTSSTIGVLVPDITNPFFPEVVRGIQEAADRTGHVLLLATTGPDPHRTAEAIAQMRSRRVAGIVIVEDRLDDETLTEALDGLRFVALDRMLDHLGATWVSSDHRAGGRMAAEHLIGLGHQKIAHLAGPQRITVARERLVGYQDGLAAAALPLLDELVVEADFSEDAGYRGALDLLARGVEFTAIFAATDMAAIGAMQALDEHNLRVPGDVSVIGFDDIHLAAYLRPGLTTVHQQIAQLGRTAVQLLLELEPAAAAESRLLPVDIVIRGTTDRARPREVIG